MTTAAAAVYVDPNTLTPWAENPRNNEEAIGKVAKSIQRFGFASPIVARTEDGRIIAGHTRHAAALRLGLEDVPVRFLDIDEQQASALALADNRLGQIATWDDDALTSILEDLAANDVDIEDLGWDADSLEDLLDDSETENIYTAKVESPIYEIKGECPETEDLYDRTRTDALMKRIEAADISEDIRQFLLSAAMRHTVFNYEQIAEYYAHASEEVQTMMEDSALIIIDFERAIELGFAKLTGDLAEAYLSNHPEQVADPAVLQGDVNTETEDLELNNE
jgi:ParB-like chromosome segregation protein Spo0J